MAIEILNVETVYKGWSSFMIATVRLADGRTIRREIEHHGVAVVVLPYDPERRTAILVRQFRAPVLYAENRQDMLEAIAGKLDETDPEAATRREAMEEAGLKLGRLEAVGTVWSMPGISTERMSLYLAPYTQADRIGPGGGLAEEHEDIIVVELPLAELAAAADAGRLIDLKTLVLTQASGCGGRSCLRSLRR